ncbi:MAG: ABC transporter substrate-binding protein [Bacteroidales bacterium]
MNTILKFFFIVLLSCILYACGNNKDNGDSAGNKTEYARDIAYKIKPDTITTKIIPKYAKGFTVSYIKNAKLVSIKDPVSKHGQCYKFALVEKENINNILVPKEYQIIEIPVKSVICMTTLQLSNFITLDNIDKVVGVTSTRFLHNKKMQQRIKQGLTHKIGIEGNFDNEVIMNINPNVIFISPFKRGGYDSMKDVHIPLVPHLGYKELSPLGQAEWIKFIALFINEEKKANILFDDIEEKYNSLKELAKNVEYRPVVFSGEMRGGGWYTVGGKSFLAQIFRDAGADYFLKDNMESGGVTLDFETIYSKASTANYWRILNGYNGTFSYKALMNEDDRYSDFKAFKNKGIIYCNLRDKGFYENSPTQPHLVLKDFIKIFHPQLIEPKYKGTFYELLK